MKKLYVTFHGIGEPLPEADAAERRYWWDKDAFLAALDQIADTESPPSIRITFDDGNMSDVAIALPALVRRKLTAQFFICAGRIGRRGYVDAAMIRELLSAGMAVGSHGLHHLDFYRLSPQALDSEARDSKRTLEDVCGESIEEISIPFGSYGRRVLAKLRSTGYARAYSSDGGIVRHEGWLIPRNTLDRSWQGKCVRREMAARNPFIRRARRAVAKRYRAIS
jgi:peptidoglycan/xylan/chitin deacetylase (PgdA/CDA1 family)